MDMNYYAMLGVACDIADADQVKEIKMKLPAWYSAQQTAFRNACDGVSKKQIEQELDEYPNMQKLLTDAALRRKHAEALKAELLQQLRSIIGIMADCNDSEKSVTTHCIRDISRKLGLREYTVRSEFKAAGFTILDSQRPDTGDVFLHDAAIRSIEGALDAIRRFAQSGSCYDEITKEAAKASDLYEYLAVMEGHTVAEGDVYRSMPTENLRQICSDLANWHNGNTSPVKDYQTLDSIGRVQVFAGEETRARYENSLRLAPLRESLLNKLEYVPQSLLRKRAFAEACIKRIQQELPDEDVAIALYNKYARLYDDDAYKKA